MAQFGKSLLAVGLLMAFWGSGCSRPVSLRSNDSSGPDTTDVPFTHVADSSYSRSGNQQTAIPVGASESLPVGTMLTVRLKDPVWTDAPEASGSFEAIVDEAVTSDGVTFISRGANVSGRVESAGASAIKSNRNYVRLTLDSISLGGRDLPIQTSSLFARGQASISANNEPGDSSAVIHLDKGRRLTFRLTEPVYVASQKTISTP
jgi:hypothetical protein